MLLFSTPIVHFLPGQSGYKRGRGWGKKFVFLFTSPIHVPIVHVVLQVFFSQMQ